MFQVSAKTDYGLLLMVSLAQSDTDGPVSLRTIAEERKLPYAFLTQIVIPLKQAGLVFSKEGVRGGYLLARPADAISVAEVVSAIDGEVNLVRCHKPHEGGCPSVGGCTLPPFWSRLTKTLNESLSSVSLADLASTVPIHHAAAAQRP